jgi:sugar phosphate isomerase/epimerase
MIRLGLCAPLDQAALLESIGYDYIEGSFTALAALEEAAFQAILRDVKALRIRAEAFNSMLPGTFRLTGPDADLNPVYPYLETAFARAAALGGKVVVFGSGAARRMPEGWTVEQAWPQLIAFLRACIPYCQASRVRVAIEPLRQAETNVLHTVREGAALAAAVDSEWIGVLGDTYHMAAEAEPFTAFAQARAWLTHVHTAEPVRRRFPAPGDGVDWRALFTALQAAGYEGRVSVEGASTDFEPEARAALAVLRAANQ